MFPSVPVTIVTQGRTSASLLGTSGRPISSLSFGGTLGALTPQGLCHWLPKAVHWICMKEANPSQIPARLSAEHQILDDNVF